MTIRQRIVATATLVLVFAALALAIGCAGGGKAGGATTTARTVPITTESAEARQLYLRGRDLLDKLRYTDARPYFERALQKDPGFALAHWGMAQCAPSSAAFFDALQRAVAAADGASEGERRLVLALDAGARGEPSKQLEHLEAVVRDYPDDVRAHNALGAYHFGRQDYAAAIEHYERAIAVDPEFSQPYNQLGYAYRFLNELQKAEATFRAYIELIPDEPNPYDSYAELLMKLGRHEESIENYREALKYDPNFVASYVGIGNNEIFLGRYAEAREAFDQLMDIARNDRERREALFWIAASFLYEGRPEQAIKILHKRLDIATAAGDQSAAASDLNFIGNVLLETGAPAEALQQFRRAIERIEIAGVPQDVKAAARRGALFFEARSALAAGDLAAAKSRAAAYGEAIAAFEVPFEVRNHHELLGRIALAEADHQAAVRELLEANQQDPRVQYLTALAYAASGETALAREWSGRAANFNGLNVNWAFVRERAREMHSSS